MIRAWAVFLSAFFVGCLIIDSMPARAGDDPYAKPYLASIFMDDMVLQRDMRDPVWGWTTPGAKVSVRIAGQEKSASAGADGLWKVLLKPMPAGGPYEMDVAGPQTVRLTNILVGDVWICSGQSNMGFGINYVNNAAQEVASANYPQIRLLNLACRSNMRPLDRFDWTHWSECNPQTIAATNFSGVAYFFGRNLYSKLNVPIGLIETAWGGTTAEAWISREGLDNLPDFKAWTDEIDSARKGIYPPTYQQVIDAWCKRNDSDHPDYSDIAVDDSYWKEIALPQNENDLGVVWYRRIVDMPASAAGKDAVLDLACIDDIDTTYVNGVSVGGLDGWNTPREYKVPGSLLRAGANVIAVRVINLQGSGGIYGTSNPMRLTTADGKSIDLTGTWKYRATVGLNPGGEPFPPNHDIQPTSPSMVYNGMIAPLIPFAITGAIWYQGEANSDRGYQYRSVLPELIRDWRQHWGQGDFPFYIVQLANLGSAPDEPGESEWAEVREAQEMTAATVDNCGIATAVDIGNPSDIHPTDKQDVGLRLSLVALAKHYHEKVVCSGPTLRSMRREGSAIRLRFGDTDGGLQVHGDKLASFAIAGADRHFVWADAKIEGDTIVVQAPSVADPVAVRYAWADNPTCSLYNGAGLPALPFRTDKWPGMSVNNK